MAIRKTDFKQGYATLLGNTRFEDAQEYAAQDPAAVGAAVHTVDALFGRERQLDNNGALPGHSPAALDGQEYTGNRVAPEAPVHIEDAWEDWDE